MKTSEIRDRGTEELRMLGDQFREELYKKKIDHTLDQLTQTHRLKELRRNIARVKTILREREKEGR